MDSNRCILADTSEQVCITIRVELSYVFIGLLHNDPQRIMIFRGMCKGAMKTHKSQEVKKLHFGIPLQVLV